MNETEAISESKKIKIYTASFLLSPLGILWFIKYFKSENPEIKRVGVNSLVITLVPLLLLLTVGGRIMDSFSEYTDVYQKNLEVYSELGL